MTGLNAEDAEGAENCWIAVQDLWVLSECRTRYGRTGVTIVFTRGAQDDH